MTNGTLIIDESKQNNKDISEENIVLSMACIETGLGSLLHGLHIPGGGFFLSQAQAYLLLRNLHLKRLKISSIPSVCGAVSLLKMMSPAGKKITPMIAIYVQGILFWAPVRFFGVGLVAKFFSAFLLLIWGSIQSIITAIILYGWSYDLVIEFIHKNSLDMKIPVLLAFFVWLGLKFLNALFLILLSKKRLSLFVSKKIEVIGMENIKKNIKMQKEKKSAFKQSLYDLLSPMFLLSAALLAFMQWSLNNNFESVAWVLVRTLSIFYFFSLLIRLRPVRLVFIRLFRTRSKAFTKAYRLASRVKNLIFQQKYVFSQDQENVNRP